MIKRIVPFIILLMPYLVFGGNRVEGMVTPLETSEDLFSELPAGKGGDFVSIEQILKHAAYESPGMLGARLKVAQNDASHLRGLATYLPEVSLGYRIGGTHEIRKSINKGDASRAGGSYSIGANHPIYHWGGVSARRDAGFASEKIAEYEAIISYLQLVRQLRESYAELIVKKFNMVVTDQKIAFKRMHFDKSKLLHDNGRVSRNELEQLELELKNLELEKTYAWNQLERSLVKFRNDSGYLDLTVEDIPTHINMPSIDIEALQRLYKSFVSEGFDRSIVRELAEEYHETIEAQLTINDARKLPTLDMQAGMSQQPVEVNNKYELQTVFFVGIGGGWKLFDRAQTSTNERSLLLRKRQVDTELATRRANLFAEGKHLLELINTGLKGYQLRKEQLELERKKRSLAEANFERGDINREKINDVKLSLLEVQAQLMGDQAKLSSTYYTFLATVFKEPALAYFDPKDHRL